MDALVTDAHIRSAVAGIRALGRAGVRVHAVAPSRAGAGLWSRHARSRTTEPDLAAAIAGLAERHGPVVAYPGREAAIDVLTARLPEGVLLPYAGAEALARVRDKRGLPALAAEAGMRVPATLYEGPAAGLEGRAPRLPFVLKAARPGGPPTSTRRVGTLAGLEHALAELASTDEPVLAQELVEGPLESVALVLDRDGRVAERFQQRALRTWPPGAGPSALAVGVEPDEALVERVAGLLRAAGYWGLAQVQLVGGAVVDVNPRFYGSMPLALASGVNLPAAWHAVAAGEPAGGPRPYRSGVSFRWMEADASAALRGMPRRLLSLSPRPAVGAMWAASDPLPGLLLAADAVRVRVGRRV